MWRIGFQCVGSFLRNNERQLAQSFRGFRTTPTTYLDKDPYEVLGIEKTATTQRIKEAYFKLAKKYHPDANKVDKDASAKFAEIREAYELLTNDERRKAYDQMGFMGDHQNQANATGYQNMTGEEFSEFMKGFGGFKDIFSEFENMMSGGPGSRRQGTGIPRKGRNIQLSMDLTFEEAAKGVKKTVSFTANVACKTCKGTGAKPGTHPTTCSTCNGSGTEATRSGFFSFSRPCRSCGGVGAVILAKCTSCQGTGKLQDRRSLKVEIPAGVDNGMSIRFSDQGEPGEFGGPPGYLFIVVNVTPSQVFRRDGPDIHVDIPISFTEAMLGTKVKVPTLDGEAEITILPGTQPGDHIKLSHKGIKLPGAPFHGHQYVNFNVYLPTQLNQRQKELIEEFAQLEPTSNMGKHESRKSFFDKLRDRFHSSEKKSHEGDIDNESREKTG